MKLEGLLSNIDYEVLQGDLNKNIRWIGHDSRELAQNSVFVAILGYESDGHDFISQAIKNGATAVVVCNDVVVEDQAITVIKTEDTRMALAVMATKFFNTPSNQFRLVGVTGTNGKTSTVFLIDRILKGAGKKTGIIGTIENRIGDQVLQTSRTTPDALALQHLFHEMVKENVNDVVMEVSSHALDLKRVHGSEFDVAVFTNLTLDHLDHHKTMDAYRDAKKTLFDMASKGVVNIDDPYGQYMIDNSDMDNVLTYSCGNEAADLCAADIRMDIAGTHFKLSYKDETYKVNIQTPGRFSVYNAMAAIGTALHLRIDMSVILEVLERDSIVNGRFQTMVSEKGYYAVVDYAHAPDGLENVLKTIREFAGGKVITVFGCGGDRDKTKRPIMGEIAGKYSDYAIITSDNPRTEDPAVIIDEVEVGVKRTKCDYEKVTDRVAGIRRGLALAGRDDIVLVAGKGHEDYQIIGKTKIHMDDREIIRDFMKESEG